MKLARGAGGCLALVAFGFFVLTWVSDPFLRLLAEAASARDTELGVRVAEAASYVRYVNGGCCCLSAAVSAGLLALGSVGRTEQEQP
jgi:hypothetical protein